MLAEPAPDDSRRIATLIEEWAAAVRRRDMPAILRHHADDILMFDVPPPLQTKGLAAYEKTWERFYAWSTEPIRFDVVHMDITAGSDVAFAAALMRCRGTEPDGSTIDLDFRLTIGLKHTDRVWLVTHEHHSIPAVN